MKTTISPNPELPFSLEASGSDPGDHVDCVLAIATPPLSATYRSSFVLELRIQLSPKWQQVPLEEVVLLPHRSNGEV